MIKYIKYIIVCIFIVVFICAIKIFITERNNLKEQLGLKDIMLENLLQDNQDNLNNIQTLYITVKQYKSLNDELHQKLHKVQDSLQIKDRQIKEILYTLSTFQKKDSIIFHDTIFLTNMDTIITNPWYNIDVKIRQPDTLFLEPKVYSEQSLFVLYEKKRINPHKCWLIRLFQPKKKVVTIKINDANPYIQHNRIMYDYILP